MIPRNSGLQELRKFFTKWKLNRSPSKTPTGSSLKHGIAPRGRILPARTSRTCSIEQENRKTSSWLGRNDSFIIGVSSLVFQNGRTTSKQKHKTPPRAIAPAALVVFATFVFE